MEVMIINFAQLFQQTSSKKSCNFRIFGLILTNFLPKCYCRAQNVDSEKGYGSGKKGMALEKKGMAWRHSKSGYGKYYPSSTYIQNFKLLACFCDFTDWFVSDLHSV